MPAAQIMGFEAQQIAPEICVQSLDKSRKNCGKSQCESLENQAITKKTTATNQGGGCLCL